MTNSTATRVRNAFAESQRIMSAFAERTGLASTSVAPRRYLWTDAYAVGNYLALFRNSGDCGQKDLALQLVNQVHHVLGRHRPDDIRTGWISGLGDADGERHPTSGGLRIGKPLPERRVGEPLDRRLEWDRDGQYFHYLTKWMRALDRVTAVTGDPVYGVWAIELARAAHAAFTWRPAPGGALRMYWKMSIDLSRPLVPSMGHHDPLDAFVTYSRLAATAHREQRPAGQLDLSAEISDAAAMCSGQRWETDDPLGIGGLLNSAAELAELCDEQPQLAALLAVVLEDTDNSLRRCLQSRGLAGPADSRLAFRELGLSIGLHELSRIRAMIDERAPTHPARTVASRLRELERYAPLADAIEQFWLSPRHQQAETWTSHEDINAVMLATSLLSRATIAPAHAVRRAKPR
jgi:hypothetical protein